MPAAPIPAEENERISELQRYEILDTAPEKSFDQLTKIAAYVCQVPVSLVSLVDTHRQWFKAKVGLDTCETPRESAFCGYTILADEPCIIEDALIDERVQDNILVLDEPKIRFYVGYPLISSQGFRLGSLCVIDFVPRSLSESQLECLKALSYQANQLIESRIDKQKISEYARSLEISKQKAEQANAAKSLFLATISHEIRTPLNGVIGILQLLSETNLTAQQLDFIDTAKASASILLSIINDVLDLSKIEAGKVELKLQPTNLKALLEDVKSILEYKADEKTLEFEVSCAPEIPDCLELDADRLRQILLNLCTNAIKFTPPAGVVTAEVHLLALKSDTVSFEISVTDTGIGIPEETQQTILAPFTQGSPHISAEYGGTGLGLAITSRLLNLMDSNLSIRSIVGEGSCFSFVLSCRTVERSRPTFVSTTSVRRSLQVLVAEDHPVNRKIIDAALRRRGHEVTMVVNGLEAVKRYPKGTFDLVLLDLQMPVMDGKETAQEIRKMASKTGRHVPIVAFTAHAFTEFQALAMDYVDDYLTKPICLKELDRILAQVAQATN